MKILITGGAGFVGSSIAIYLARAGHEVCVLDNLKRKGSELSVTRLAEGAARFVHGDVRLPADIEAVGKIDLLIDASAEPSVHFGYGGDPRYLIDTNLVGTVNCLEWCRKCGAAFILLSTSRVYPIVDLCALPLQELSTRFDLAATQQGAGYSWQGIAPNFGGRSSRSMYGATKLASEHLVTEYAAMYAMRTMILRCGVIAGPWQMGKVDQGFVALWVAAHLFGREVKYMGFGGAGKQVRDILHIDDLCRLVDILTSTRDWSAFAPLYCIGGGREVNVSLLELTHFCEETTQQSLPIGSEGNTREADIPWFISDTTSAAKDIGWRPQKNVLDIVSDTTLWMRTHLELVRPYLGT